MTLHASHEAAPGDGNAIVMSVASAAEEFAEPIHLLSSAESAVELTNWHLSLVRMASRTTTWCVKGMIGSDHTTLSTLASKMISHGSFPLAAGPRGFIANPEESIILERLLSDDVVFKAGGAGNVRCYFSKNGMKRLTTASIVSNPRCLCLHCAKMSYSFSWLAEVHGL